MSPPLKDIHWLSSPLAIEQRDQLGNKFKSIFHMNAPDLLLPQKERHISTFRFTAQIKHWALEIDGVCYEVQLRSWERLKALRFFTDIGTAASRAAEDWKAFRDDHNVKYERWKVGQTRMTHDQIMDRLHYIWDRFNHDMYLFLVQNCQNFTRMLCQSISVPDDDPDILGTERSGWRSMPDPASYLVAIASQATLAGGGGVPSTISLTRLALASLAPSAGAVESGMAAAAAGAGGAAAGAATGEAIEETSTGILEGHSSAAAAGGHSSVAAGGHGSAAAAGNAGIGGKGALGTKFSWAGQGVLHGAGASKAAIAVKAGCMVALAHPVVAVGAVGLGVLAAGKRDRGWIKKHKKNLPGEMDDTNTMMVVDEAEFEATTLSDAVLAEDQLFQRYANEPMEGAPMVS